MTKPQRVGEVELVVGPSVRVHSLNYRVGKVILVGDDTGVPAGVVTLDTGLASCMPLDNLDGLRVESPVRGTGLPAIVPVNPVLLGRVIGAAGRSIDGKGPIYVADHIPVHGSASNTLKHARTDTPVAMGVRVLDTLVTLGCGQRIGLLIGFGVGKSTLMSMIARGTNAEVCVIALVGERSREMREFLEDDLDEEGLSCSVAVITTSDESLALRKRATFIVIRVTKYYHDAGCHVLLMIDSLTRTYMVRYGIGLLMGELPATCGYPPPTFSMMAQLPERADSGAVGPVIDIHTMLVDGDDHSEPIADQARSVLDGHVVLDRKLTVARHYPAVGALVSIPRVASKVCTREQKEITTALRQVMGARRGVQDLLDVGVCQQGTSPEVDLVLQYDEEIEASLTQKMDERVTFDEAWQQLFNLYQSFQKEQAA